MDGPAHPLAFGRRPFLAGGGALLALIGALPAGARGHALHIATAGKPDGGFAAEIMGAGGEILASVDLPERGHGNAMHPAGLEAVIFARRPGRHALVVEIATGAVRHTIDAAGGRHFYGHGAFSPDGRLLFATENDFTADRGVLGVYDVARGYERSGEMPTHGLGPHQVLRRGDRLYLGNGGILTRPDSGRQKLNIDSMVPSLAVFDAADGRLVDQRGLPDELHRLSLRHLSASAEGIVAIGGQWQGAERPDVPLVWIAPPGGALEPLATPDAVTAALRGYVGSIEFDVAGRYLAVTSPVGGRLAIWDMHARSFVGSHAIFDVCALAPEPGGGFLAMSGSGAIWRVDPARNAVRPLTVEARGGLMWDNHAGLLDS